jgi:hypothetical protein
MCNLDSFSINLAISPHKIGITPLKLALSCHKIDITPLKSAPAISPWCLPLLLQLPTAAGAGVIAVVDSTNLFVFKLPLSPQTSHYGIILQFISHLEQQHCWAGVMGSATTMLIIHLHPLHAH